MRVGSVPIGEVLSEGVRLTGAFHLSEDQRAVATVKRTSLTTDALNSLVEGRGIFRGPIFRRRYVADLAHGEPYVSAKDLVMADVRPSAYLSHSHGGLLDALRLHEGMILITCSGMNLGEAIWTRRDLEGLVGSHDLIRICPDASAIPPGYVYAYLASRYGHALIRKHIYGGNIKHVEPQHIADLPVLRLGEDVERLAHELVERAAINRCRAVGLLRLADDSVRNLLVKEAGPSGEGLWSAVPSTRLQARCDAYYFSATCEFARRAFDNARVEQHLKLSAIAEIFIPGIFKRKYADDARHGVPYITGGDVVQLAPKSNRYLMHRVVSDNRLLIEKGTILIQEAGQLGGLIGHSVMAGSYLDGFAVSNNMVRVRARDRRDAGFLYALLSTKEGVTLIAREAAGSSIPHMDATRLRELRLPWPSAQKRHKISALVDEAIKLRDLSIAAEDEACALVERAIEEAD